MSTTDQSVTFQSGVNLVMVPVVVRDNLGKPVGNLHKEDFQLFDKGKPQVITKFVVETPGAHASATPIPAEPGEETSAPAKPPPPIADHYVAYVFDDIHISFGDLAQVREAADRHMIASLGATDRAAIFTTSGQVTLDFTDDRQKLHDALFKLRPTPIARSAGQDCPDISYYQADQMINKGDSQALAAAVLDIIACENIPQQAQASAPALATAAAQQVLTIGEHETQVSLMGLELFVRRISAMPGQRSIVLVSPGFYTTDSLRPREFEIIERAVHANVTINALDARGLYTIDAAGDISSPVQSGLAMGPKNVLAMAAAQADEEVMAELADGTGGSFFHNRNDYLAGFNVLAAPPEFSYLIGFTPETLKTDGSFHRLKVVVKSRTKYSVQARHGYFAPTRKEDAAELARSQITDEVYSREEIHDLPVELHTQFFKSGDQKAEIAVLAHVDLRQLRFRKADGRNQDNLTLVCALFDRNGNFVKGLEKRIEMHLKDDTLQRLGKGITVRTSFDVTPGDYVIRLVVRDAEGQMMSAENGSIEIP